MDDTVLTALLCAAVAVLSGAVLYQRIVLQAQMRQSLEEMTAVLGRVLDGESGEQVMVFTQDQALTGLIAQINRLLEERQRRRAEYRRTEQAVRRMLANISHDIRTPMTVVLGYLEIMAAEGVPGGAAGKGGSPGGGGHGADGSFFHLSQAGGRGYGAGAVQGRRR